MRSKLIILFYIIITPYLAISQVETAIDTTSNQLMEEEDVVIILDSIDCPEILPASRFYTDVWRNEHTISAHIFKKDTNYILPLENENTGKFVFPCSGHVISKYGYRGKRMHTGIDIKQKHGDSIVAAWGGVVRMARMGYYGYGGIVVIRHDNGLETVYAHLSRVSVRSNQKVEAGELIGRAGRTGRASTEHLHFETRFLYNHFNPSIIIDFDNQMLITDTLIVSKGSFLSVETYRKKEDNTKDTINIDSVFTAVPQYANDSLATDSGIETLPKEPIEPQTIYTPQYHIIKKGDTLYGLTKKYHTSIKRLCEINNISENDTLHIGQKIKLR